MASIKRLKKELDYLTSELLFGCYIAEITNSSATEEITKISQDIINLHNETIDNINGFRRSNKETEKNAKKYFKELRLQLVDSTQEIVNRIESLNNKNSNMIKITLPDNSVREYPSGVTGFEIAQSISPRLAENVMSVTVNDDLWI